MPARDERPVIAITMGDPAGVGPEVILKALRQPRVRRSLEPLLVGVPTVFVECARRYGWPLHLEPYPRAGRTRKGSLLVKEISTSGPLPLPGARLRAAERRQCGDTSYRAVAAAVELVRRNEAAALVTAPIAKAHWAAAGYDVPGHTELLAQLAGNVPVRMMMAGARLRVVLMTTHVPLAEVPRRLDRDIVEATIRITHRALQQQFGLPSPRLALAGLNPHAGEGGLFGREDEEILRPAVARAQRRGIKIAGPLPADTVFFQAYHGAYDAVLCPYHDQALAPFKLVHFHDGVNVTLGLPFIRTSPDHGTAFDIAGQNRADPRSMAAALLLAAELACHNQP
ncbi:MAG: 4-hydroxythreonine-4-phosphate dehydrogenase PdxA [Candidatus Binatia bacterium]|nr:4-hydroxythreonine-4-phosphate dehydrogenase PdxA [Candidatus Binatia bacterium]